MAALLMIQTSASVFVESQLRERGGFLCADLIDSIKADVDSIEFDWVVGAAPMAYKGKLKFSICAIRTDVDGSVLQEWHSHIGEGTVAAGLEATAENVGGVDLMAHLQSLAAQAEANRSASETARKKPRVPKAPPPTAPQRR